MWKVTVKGLQLVSKQVSRDDLLSNELERGGVTLTHGRCNNDNNHNNNNVNKNHRITTIMIKK